MPKRLPICTSICLLPGDSDFFSLDPIPAAGGGDFLPDPTPGVADRGVPPLFSNGPHHCGWRQLFLLTPTPVAGGEDFFLFAPTPGAAGGNFLLTSLW